MSHGFAVSLYVYATKSGERRESDARLESVPQLHEDSQATLVDQDVPA
ncbi:MAG TPA: hypothetical protein VNM92_10855 [Thermoanaerobaculia bacterium]|nr:hypothetical protein [Thermoanaerobaculia bacterium]